MYCIMRTVQRNVKETGARVKRYDRKMIGMLTYVHGVDFLALFQEPLHFKQMSIGAQYMAISFKIFIFAGPIHPVTVIVASLPAIVVTELSRLDILGQGGQHALHLCPADHLPNVDVLDDLRISALPIQKGNHLDSIFLSAGCEDLLRFEEEIVLKHVQVVEEFSKGSNLVRVEV